MNEINACIVSFFMGNVNPKTAALQRQVVEKYNVSKYPHYSIQTNILPGPMMDYIWCMNGIDTKTFKEPIEKKMDHDVILFLDIDAVPLSDRAIDFYVERAAQGRLIGNAQRSNHIQNNQHVFAAPSAVAMSCDTFITIGRPSAVSTSRGDVGEEWTFRARESGIVPIDIILPLRFDAPPIRMDWEKNAEPYWPLADGMPPYGIGTTFGNEEYGDLFYHNYQIFHPGQQERFWAKCESLLKV
jgi:hypothetical protein